MAQGNPQLKFERNPCNNLETIDATDGRTDGRTTGEFRFHELC